MFVPRAMTESLFVQRNSVAVSGNPTPSGNPRPITYCSEYEDFGCCTKREDKQSS